MHKPIQDHLEDYLSDPHDRNIPPEFRAHLSRCEACATEVGTLQNQARSLRTLRIEEDVEPLVGFYARVMNRVDQGKPESFWTVFLEPAFGRRLAFACAALVLLMGTYLVSTEPGSDPLGSGPVVVIQPPSSGGSLVQPQEQRDAVLVNLASYHE
jgi:anti-sigma factor RsiW